MDVQLSHHVPRHSAGVLHVDDNLAAVARSDASLRESQIRERKGRVAEPIPERIQRFAADVPVPRREARIAFRIVREVVIVVQRFLPGCAGPADG